MKYDRNKALHALLYLSAKPLDAEDIAKTLGVARSNVSTSLRELQGWGIVRVTHLLGDRRDHFVSLTDVWEMFRIDRVGMVANVNKLDAAELSQSSRKRNELVDVAGPFPEEAELRRDNANEIPLGTGQFYRNSKRA